LKQEELIAHYSAIADTLSIPMFLYNIPARTGNTIQPETARALASHPNIIGIKDSRKRRKPERFSRCGARH
ncbi:dihydrodipicolinate synthase family protein, partial [Pseudomonas aeruginosa]|uniref:dihydrodipicolinate synthase family protein n=1 Tax=Pseudomonas aeruginosa TaxID=287 RepID=UPI0031B6E210